MVLLYPFFRGDEEPYFTEYRLAAMLSATLSRAQLFPPSFVLKRMPLPPAAQASSCTLHEMQQSHFHISHTTSNQSIGKYFIIHLTLWEHVTKQATCTWQDDSNQNIIPEYRVFSYLFVKHVSENKWGQYRINTFERKPTSRMPKPLLEILASSKSSVTCDRIPQMWKVKITTPWWQ